MTDNYYRKGAQVIYHFKVWQQVYWSDSGWGWVSQHKKAVIVCQPRNEYGRFTNDFRYEYEVYVRLKDEDGKIFDTTLDNIEPNRCIADLSDEEFKELWENIRRGSMYMSDYQNSVGVFQNFVYDYYEGFGESLKYEIHEENPDWDWDAVEKEVDRRDNLEEFKIYCRGCEWSYDIAA